LMPRMVTVSAILRENPFIHRLGIELVALEDDLCVGKMPLRNDDLNHIGVLHGGVSYTLADIVTGALAHAHANGQAVTTTGGEIHYLKGIGGIQEVYCRARTIKKGRTLSVYEARITDETGERLFAQGTFTYFILDQKI